MDVWCMSFPSWIVSVSAVWTIDISWLSLQVCTYCLCVRTIYVYVLYMCTYSLYVRWFFPLYSVGPLTAATTSYRAARGWTNDSDHKLVAVRNADNDATGTVFKAAAAQPSQVLAIHIEQMTLSELIQSSRWWRRCYCQNSWSRKYLQ
jgi:hypothetical protein